MDAPQPKSKIPVLWPWRTVGHPTRMYNLASKLTMMTMGLIAHVGGSKLNSINVHNRDILDQAFERPKGRPLLTVSNHYSCLDDPAVWGMLKLRHLLFHCEKYIRWTVAASDICFTKKWHCHFFGLGRVAPVIRGGGVYQRGMDLMIEKLDEGEWVHIFAEGGINMEHEVRRLKWGVGRLIAESSQVPLVIPLWHHGMDQIMANYPPYYPRFGKTVTLVVGEPIDFTELLKILREEERTPKETRKAITDQIQDRFVGLKEECERLHFGAVISNGTEKKS